MSEDCKAESCVNCRHSTTAGDHFIHWYCERDIGRPSSYYCSYYSASDDAGEIRNCAGCAWIGAGSASGRHKCTRALESPETYKCNYWQEIAYTKEEAVGEFDRQCSNCRHDAGTFTTHCVETGCDNPNGKYPGWEAKVAETDKCCRTCLHQKGGLCRQNPYCVETGCADAADYPGWEAKPDDCDDIKATAVYLDESATIPDTPSPSVHSPSHYTQGSVECIDAIESAIVNLSGIEAFCTANAIKYLWRWKDKNGLEDLEKAKWYIDRLIFRRRKS